MVFCPRCGARNPDKAQFCNACGVRLVRASQYISTEKKTLYPTAAGILTIIAACVLISLGIIYMAAWIKGQTTYFYPYGPGDYYTRHSGEYIFAGIFELLGFAFGLTAGILTLKRNLLPMAIVGMALMIVGSILSFVNLGIGLAFGLPVIVLTILSVIFIGISKREFT